MKKFILISSIVLLGSASFAADGDAPAPRARRKKMAPASAAASKSYSREYGSAGCGLGSVLIGKKGGQIFASTTNGTVSSQLFGITSGTLNCVDSASSVVASRADMYIEANRYTLESDVAKGNGETLAGLSKVLGCKSDRALGSALQKNYGEVFTSGAYPNEVTDSILSVIIDNKELSTECPLS